MEEACLKWMVCKEVRKARGNTMIGAHAVGSQQGLDAVHVGVLPAICGDAACMHIVFEYYTKIEGLIGKGIGEYQSGDVS